MDQSLPESPMKPVQSVAIIGAGNMGSGIAQKSEERTGGVRRPDGGP